MRVSKINFMKMKEICKFINFRSLIFDKEFLPNHFELGKSEVIFINPDGNIKIEVNSLLFSG